MSDWRPWHSGPRPDTGGKKIKARLRCVSREDAENQTPQLPEYWKRWTHDFGPGDIIEIKEMD